MLLLTNVKSSTLTSVTDFPVIEFCESLTKPFSAIPVANAVAVASLLKSPLLVTLGSLDPLNTLAEYSTIFPEFSYLLGSIIREDRDIFTNTESSEDDFHSLWDDIIRSPLHVLSRHGAALNLQMTRNRVDAYKSGTTQNLPRPDFLCHLRGALVLRGEEKRETTELDKARGELISKFGSWSPMFYGGLPFVLGYATGGLYIKCVPISKCVPFRLTLN